MENIIIWGVIAYLFLISIIAFGMFYTDKSRAKRKEWRIPEKQLLFISLIGGSAGALCGMYLFRHKTKHVRFFVGIPMILLLQIIVTTYLFM